MYVDLHHVPAFAAGDVLHRVATSLTAGSFLLAVGLAAALLSLWSGARHCAARLARI